MDDLLLSNVAKRDEEWEEKTGVFIKVGSLPFVFVSR